MKPEKSLKGRRHLIYGMVWDLGV